MNELYYNKYLKYKQKYLLLKQSGENNNTKINSILDQFKTTDTKPIASSNMDKGPIKRGRSDAEQKMNKIKIDNSNINCNYYHIFLIQILDSLIIKFNNFDEIKKNLDNIKNTVVKSLGYYKKYCDDIIKDTLLTYDNYDKLRQDLENEKQLVKHYINICINQYNDNEQKKKEYNNILTTLGFDFFKTELLSFDDKNGQTKFFNYVTKYREYKNYTEKEKFEFMKIIQEIYGKNYNKGCFEILSEIIDTYFKHIDDSITLTTPHDIQVIFDNNKKFIETKKTEQKRKEDKMMVLQSSINKSKQEIRRIIRG